MTLRNGAIVRLRAIHPDAEGTADIGLVVADVWQGLGLGSSVVLRRPADASVEATRQGGS